MTPLQPATVEPEELELTINEMLSQWEAGNATLRAMLPNITRRGDAIDAIRAVVTNEHLGVEYYVNETYQVAKRDLPNDAVHLSIKRIDRQPVHDWRDMQAIKNQLVGVECEGVELYPAESRLVDGANQYHIWTCKDPAFRFPFGFTTRAVSDNPIGKSQNRKL